MSLLVVLLISVIALAVAVIATRSDDRNEGQHTRVDMHGYRVPGAGPCCERRGSLAVERRFVGL